MTGFVAWLLALCLAPQATTLGGVLTGTVLSDDGAPVDRAIVTILGSVGPGVRVSATNAAGEFSMGGLPAGSFAIWAAKPGLVTTYYGSKRPGRGPAIPIALATGQRATVSLTMLRGASISGTVTDPSGRPLAQISMQVRPASLSGVAASATLTSTTDARGGYRVFGLAPGDYIVEALPPVAANPHAVLVTADEVKSALQQAQQANRSLGPASSTVAPSEGPAVAYAPTFFPGVAIRDQAINVAVSAGEQRDDVTFSLQLVRAARISGRVTGSAGEPMSGAHLALVRLEPAALSPLRAVPGAPGSSLRLPVSHTGEFSAAGLVPGTYTLWARWDANIVGPPDAGTRWGHARVVVDGFDVSDVVLGLQAGGRVSGMIRLDSASPTPAMDTFRISLSPQFSDAAPFTSTLVTTPDKSGRFVFPSVPPGPYGLRTTPGAATAGSSADTWVLESAIAAGHDVADSPLDVRMAEDISDVIVTLTDQETEISGTLLDAAKRPTAQFSLLFFSVDRNSWTPRSRRVQTVQPAVDGTFRVKGLPPGEYFVVADANVDSGTVLDAAYLEQLVVVASRITIARGEKRRVDLAVTGR
jgi:protocatechuate 3,4-dioxygenase beta subunit